MRSLEYNFTGYQVPAIPRASRSARGRGPIRKKRGGNQIRAFEILASVAGNLLRESESSVPTNAACVKDSHHILYSNSRRKREDEGESLKEDPYRHEDCSEKLFVHTPSLHEHHNSYKVNGFSHARDNLMLEIDSTLNTYGQSEMIFFSEKWATVSSTNNCRCSSSTSSILGDSACYGEHFEDKVGCVFEGKLGAESYKSKSKTDGIPCAIDSSEDPIKLDMESHALVSSESDAKASLLRDCISHASFLKHCDNVKVVSRDDDEKSVECTQPSTISKFSRPPPDIGERRIKKLSASRQLRQSQNLKGGKTKPMYCNGTYYHIDERSQNIYPFKKRKFYSQSPLCSSDGGFHHEDISDFPKKRIGDYRSSAIGASSSVTGQVSSESKGCNVKLSIKSFKVPELFIEIPATATVGSLKRTVMEAMTAALGNGLHVGILLQGKMVRDDNKTLLQTGISQDQKRQNLGFILEPRRSQITPPACTEDPSLLSGGTPLGISRSGTSYVSQDPLLKMSSCVESNLNIVPSLADIITGNNLPETQAVVAVPLSSTEALAVVPFHRKSHSEYVQRRIRRPFSVSEVEALVQAVEKFGTGRWRDVKLQAFDSAKHRTYVDLKDKWKTLVHTARISPQQRRGEPVPQELLDRVLAAHAYWSQHQTRQQPKTDF